MKLNILPFIRPKVTIRQQTFRRGDDERIEAFRRRVVAELARQVRESVYGREEA